MNLRKTSWCNGCYLDFAVREHGESVAVIPRPQPWWPDAVELYLRGAQPEPDQPHPELGCMVGFLKDPRHCEDGDCLVWLERHGESGMAYHLAQQFGVIGHALQIAGQYIPAEVVEKPRKSP